MTAKRKNWELDNPEPHLHNPLTNKMAVLAMATPLVLFLGIGVLVCS